MLLKRTVIIQTKIPDSQGKQEMMDLIQQAVFEGIYEAQAAHPVEPMFSLAELMALGEEEAAAAVNGRAEKIRFMTEYPLDHCWVPPDWWLFLLLLCERRLEMPGSVLEQLISGGIRSGKSFIVAMLMVAHWKYTKRADIFCLSGTQPTSEKLQQQPFEKFLPREALGGDKGAIKQTKHEKAKFSGGKFTDNKFTRYMTVTDERGLVYRGGGAVEFKMFSQDPELFKGYSLTSVWWDEKCPVILLEKCYDRIISRAVETRETWHREKMLVLREQLAALVEGRTQKRPHPALLGALMHGVMIGSYTPEEGYVATVRRYLQGATKPAQYMVVAPELADKPGVKDPMVPKVAFCAARNRMVGYLHTSANKMVDSYTELSRAADGMDERGIRIKLYGDCDASDERFFSAFTPDHIRSWADVPENMTLFFSVDPAPAKPWSIGLYGADALGRVWCLMEWPSPGVLVRMDHGWMDPGPWAVPTAGEHVNGDRGPAAKLRLHYTFKDYTQLMHEMLALAYQKLTANGHKWTGQCTDEILTWEDGHQISDRRVVVNRIIADKRYLGVTERRGEDVKTNWYWLLKEENAFNWEIHKDDSQGVGLMAITRVLSERMGGLPGLLVVAEKDAQGELKSGCLDTLFSLQTYTTEDGKDSPPRGDEACKEAIDRLRYLLKCGVEFVGGEMSLISSGGAR